MENIIRIKTSKEYYCAHREEILNQKKEYYSLNRQKIKEEKKIYYITHLEEARRYYEKHKKLRKKYLDSHRKETNNRSNLYNKNKKKTDINFKLRLNLRCRIYDAIKNNCKSKHTLELLGCSVEKLKQHLEQQFKDGMSWENWGAGRKGKGMQEWHIDHIKPCVSFDLSKPEEQLKCFHYTNLQPLWAYDNIVKRNKYHNQKFYGWNS